MPDWGTFEDTFGAAEVWHELLDPVFGHPILTAAFFQFYKYFLKGKANGGLATGFCTSLASVVTDKLWKGENDTHTQTKAGLQKMLTAVHGKLLSRESLLHFHDQSRARAGPRGAHGARDRGDVPARHGPAERSPAVLHPLGRGVGLGVLRPAGGFALRDAVAVRVSGRASGAAAFAGLLDDG